MKRVVFTVDLDGQIVMLEWSGEYTRNWYHYNDIAMGRKVYAMVLERTEVWPYEIKGFGELADDADVPLPKVESFFNDYELLSEQKLKEMEGTE